jgi:hypothetical protein
MASVIFMLLLVVVMRSALFVSARNNQIVI